MALTEICDFSPEQLDFLENSNADVNICSGPVRSGKNFIENVRMLGYSRFEPYANPKSDLLFAGASRDSCFRIFLEDFFQVVGRKNFTYSQERGKGKIFGRNFYVFGFTDANDFGRLRGATGGGFLGTEMTLAHPSFIAEAEARCSVDGAKMFWDTNPDSEFHHVYTDYIGNKEKIEAESLKVFYFTFNSNLSIKEGYKRKLKLAYKPGTLLYKRLILGLWVAAEGVVYDAFDSQVNTCHPDQVPECDEYAIACDYGTSNPTVFLLIGRVQILPGMWKYYVIREYYHHGLLQGQKTTGQYLNDLLEFIHEQGPIRHKIKVFIIDPSAAPFKAEINSSEAFEATGIKMVDAVNDVDDGIAVCSSLYHQALLVISRACEKTLAEQPKYIWDKNAQKRGLDVPLKRDDHGMDAKRYGIMTPWDAADQFDVYLAA